MSQFLARILGLRRDKRGAAAAEFAIILALLVIPLLNAIDLGIYAYDYMELRDAAQVAAQAVWARCAPTQLVPAGVSCPGYQNEAVNTAHGTPLWTNASIGFGGYFAASTQLSTMTGPGEGFACLVGGVLKSTSEQPTGFDETTASQKGRLHGSRLHHGSGNRQQLLAYLSSGFDRSALVDTHCPCNDETRLMRQAARYLADSSGTSAAEFALVVLPFFALVFSIIWMGLLLYSNNELQQATESASRCWSVNASCAGSSATACAGGLCADSIQRHRHRNI